jgi:hypothetical protein
MSNLSSTTKKLVCGLDLGDKESWFCICTAEGVVVEEGKVRTTTAGLTQRFQSCAAMRIALETGTHSP